MWNAYIIWYDKATLLSVTGTAAAAAMVNAAAASLCSITPDKGA
jgi:hypothetical protein